LKFQQKTFDEIENRAIAQQRHEQLMKAQEAQRQATLQARDGTDDLKRQLTEARIREINERINRANKKSEDAGKNDKPPAKEIVNANKLRNNLLPKLETAIPVLDRLHKEGRWGTLTTLLALDPRAAEVAFKNDPEAINLILTFAYFRSKEFEDAGKALTRKEDQILAPIVRGDLRVYEGIRNALVEGQKTLAVEQKQLENVYPYIKKINDAFRKEMSSTFEIGKIYTDAKGNKAKYLGPDEWEEVK
jgi:flagellar hook-basal body complex protein FliE